MLAAELLSAALAMDELAVVLTGMAMVAPMQPKAMEAELPEPMASC